MSLDSVTLKFTDEETAKDHFEDMEEWFEEDNLELKEKEIRVTGDFENLSGYFNSHF